MTSIPKDFLLGAATAAYQIEGAVDEDNRGPSIWDVFSHTPERTRNGDTGDVACDHYHRYQEDIALMKQMGLSSYRFSLAWTRLFPTGSGTLNEAGLDFYRRLVDGLLEAGVQPAATLYHWDLPQALMQQGGWTNRETADRFADYAHTVFKSLADLVPMYITLNEPWCSSVLGHLFGEHAPGLKDLGATLAASHNLLRAHGLAVQAFRDEHLKSSKIGLTNILTNIEPASDKPDDLAAAAKADAVLNRWFLDPVFRGSYPALLESFGIDKLVQPGDLESISQPIDFLGVNYYQTNIIRANPADPLLGAALDQPRGPRTAMDWGIAPEGLRSLLNMLQRDYPELPIYITESGAAFDDHVVDGIVQDPKRIEYIKGHLREVLRARQDGVDVRGYFVWSLLDNFEWAFGYDKRFGLIYVDYKTQDRIWKDSAKWYQEIIQTRQL
ncbi:GH1 family beta-glucosidase [Alicyclobacillus ferrooxydans]|uniref:Beta-glucosidase n=1 Tax=Alicyclobacillus ferrooxydans TaxID=471514 RepID=A0A0P9CFM9_9BACL|nr:GH1 family beta-glucosidase [Alicyclobacillus ferrooxydans]KPV44600.1 beta-glucosidase [Alicyclobacillus ferrooxydans]